MLMSEFSLKFIGSCFCTCAVKMRPKITLNAVKFAKFEAINRKSWLPRTMVVKDFWQRSRLMWFCACAMRSFTQGHTVLADNSICLNRRAIQVVCIVNRHISIRDFKYVRKICPIHICHVTRRMRSGCKCIVRDILWEMSELITQEDTAIASSNLVEGMTTWSAGAIRDHWPRSKGQKPRAQGHVTYQQPGRYKYAIISNLVEIFTVGYTTRDTLSRPVSQLDQK